MQFSEAELLRQTLPDTIQHLLFLYSFLQIPAHLNTPSLLISLLIFCPAYGVLENNPYLNLTHNKSPNTHQMSFSFFHLAPCST
nr:MAG TPA: hypothetical protein [Caudoviricetes sp.]